MKEVASSRMHGTIRHAAPSSLIRLPLLSNHIHLFASCILFQLCYFHPLFLSLPPHGLLCEGIEFIIEHWAGHTTTINSLHLMRTRTHTEVNVLTALCQPNQTNPLHFLLFLLSGECRGWRKEKGSRYATQKHTFKRKMCAQRDHIPLHTTWSESPLPWQPASPDAEI